MHIRRIFQDRQKIGQNERLQQNKHLAFAFLFKILFKRNPPSVTGVTEQNILFEQNISIHS